MSKLFFKIKVWFCLHILRRKHFTAIDLANGADYTVKIAGYIEPDGCIHVSTMEKLP